MDSIEQFYKTLENKNLTAIDYIEEAYEIILWRKVDQGAIDYYEEQIQNGNFNPNTFIRGLYDSVEFKMNQSNFNWMVHTARQQWVTTLKKVDKILDIGGSSPNVQEGALIELGYKHRPKLITILDLPEEEQYWGKPKWPQDIDYVFDWGVLNYEHGRVEQIEEHEKLANQKYDMIFMGEVVEHIQPESLGKVFNWIKNHLEPDGSFIFDTPNRIVTKLLNPNGYIDADHKYEYTPNELRKKLEHAGLQVVKEYGLVQMNESVKSGVFNPLEIKDTSKVNRDAENSYLFAFECRQKVGKKGLGRIKWGRNYLNR